MDFKISIFVNFHGLKFENLNFDAEKFTKSQVYLRSFEIRVNFSSIFKYFLIVNDRE